MKYIYGPVKSRRLGLSLGITLTPHKICTFDCIYCQLGKTTELTSEREEYVPIGEVLNELKYWLENNPREAKTLNYITLSGAGEPSLNIKVGQLISEIKRITGIPLAVITNASLLNSASLRQELRFADLIVPSLDAVTAQVFQKLDRPEKDINVEEVIDGLINLRKEFPGRIWLEVMLVKGLNDDLRHIKKLKQAIGRINPDKIQLNSPVRTAAGIHISAVGKNKLNKIKEILGDKSEIL